MVPKSSSIKDIRPILIGLTALGMLIAGIAIPNWHWLIWIGGLFLLAAIASALLTWRGFSH